jgi:hypothetical protein
MIHDICRAALWAAALLLASATAALAQQAAPPPVKIGIVTFLTGPAAAPFGIPGRNAAEILVEEKFGVMDVVMSALASREITVLFVEHDMEIVARFADRVLAFYDGTVIADGSPAAALADPQVQAFISGARREGSANA